MIRFPCPHCGEKFKIDDSYAGRSTKCPRCRNRITVPLQGDPPSAHKPSAGASAAPSATLPISPSPTKPAPSPRPPSPSPAKPATPAVGTADPLASLAEAASLSGHVPSAAAPTSVGSGAAELAAAAPAPSVRRWMPPVRSKPEPLEPRLKILSAVLGGVLLVTLFASALVQGNSPPVVSSETPRVFELRDPPGGEPVDLKPDAADLAAIGAAVRQFVKRTGGLWPGHVGELLEGDQLKPESFVSVLRGNADGPSYSAAQDPFDPYRFGDYVFMFPVYDGVTLPNDAIIAASARGDPTGQRVILTADGKTRVVQHGEFLGLMQQQNLLRWDAWGRMPPVSARLFE